MSTGLADSWETVALGDVLTRITYGFTNPMPTTVTGPYMVTAKDVRNGHIDYSTARHTSRKAFNTLLTDKSRPRVGDVLLTKDGSIGRVAVCDRDDMCINQSVALLQPSEAAVSAYLSYLLQTPKYQALMEADAGGSTIKHIYITRVGKMMIPLPPVAQQRAIAEVLGALDNKIAANRRLEATVKDLLAARFASLRIDVDGRESVRLELNDLIELNPKLPSPGTQEPVYLDMRNLPHRAMTVTSWGHRAARGGARFQNGDTLLARITPCLENGKAGYVDFLNNEEVGFGSTEFIVMRARSAIPSILPYFLATSPRFREFAIRHMSGTSGRQRLSAGNLRGFTLGQPRGAELSAFAAISVPLMDRVKAAADESRWLVTARDELLPLLMSERIRVKDVESFAEGVV